MNVIPNVLAARYASPEVVRPLVARAQGRRSSASSGSRCCGPSATSASTSPTASSTTTSAVVDTGRPRLDRRARAGHPARREGADRGVLRPRRARARPQGHDLPRPHRERRAAAGPARRCELVAGPDGRRAGPAGRARRRARRAGDGRPQPQRRRAGHHARQAVRQRRPTSCCVALAPARGPARPLPAARHQGPGRHRAGHARPARRRRRQARRARAPGRRAPRLRRACSTSVGQVYPRSLDFDVVSALVQLGRRRRRRSPPRSG